jgi:hypothetical protein
MATEAHAINLVCLHTRMCVVPEDIGTALCLFTSTSRPRLLHTAKTLKKCLRKAGEDWTTARSQSVLFKRYHRCDKIGAPKWARYVARREDMRSAHTI